MKTWQEKRSFSWSKSTRDNIFLNWITLLCINTSGEMLIEHLLCARELSRAHNNSLCSTCFSISEARTSWKGSHKQIRYIYSRLQHKEAQPPLPKQAYFCSSGPLLNNGLLSARNGGSLLPPPKKEFQASKNGACKVGFWAMLGVNVVKNGFSLREEQQTCPNPGRRHLLLPTLQLPTGALPFKKLPTW